MDLAEKLNANLAAQGKPTFNFFGPNANCTLALCPPTWSVYGYRPALGASVAPLVFFAVALLVHVVLGHRWREWSFMACMICGCVDEMLGYGARVWMYHDLWNFNAFMVQVVCITTGPVFYCAAIYMVLAKIISTLAPELSRFRPSLLYRVFIPCDVVSLLLQAVGGALSAASAGLSRAGTRVALAGLALQVVTLLAFCAAYADFAWRCRHHHSAAYGGSSSGGGPHSRRRRRRRMRAFYAFEMLAVVMILARCIFRVAELSDGYGGKLVKREDLFVGLEGVPIVIAAFALCIGHPGLIFNDDEQWKAEVQT